jgi:hypothetical protein
MIWMVIFNHKAESSTFIIATSAIFLWFLSGRVTITNTIMIAFVLVFTSLSLTDVFPGYVRDTYIEPYVIKAIPCMVIWGKILYDLFRMKDRELIGASEKDGLKLPGSSV